MCGITGFASATDRFDTGLLDRASAVLAHRGPDDHGAEVWSATGKRPQEGAPFAVGLAQRRLSIIDLSPDGHQPMSNEDGSVWITYNGEFYNFGEFADELKAQGHVFRSRCDTETILHLYEQHGIEPALKRMNGMFAFGLWDSRRRQLILARDRLGKKPLYYALLPDGGLVFASEMKAILATGLIDRERIDAVALDQMWTFGYTMGERTIFEQIRRLPAANYAVWADGRLELHEYWDCPFGGAVDRRRPDELADELDALLRNAIRLRLISDVPLGVFLSGGIDSSLITALAAKVAGADLGTFTIAFQEKEYDEAPFAQRISAHLKIRNTVLTVKDDMAGTFRGIAAHFDEPFGDSSAIPTYYVSKTARQHVTVALTGDGGDEVFAGYPWHREGLRLWGPAEMRRRAARALTFGERLRDVKLRMLGPQRGFSHVEKLLSLRRHEQVFSPEFLRLLKGVDSWRDREKWFSRVAGSDVLSQMQYVNIKTYMVDDILVKVDRMSMAHALECRSPYLDHRVVEFAARLPYEAKMDAAMRGKAILRRLLERHVPREMFNRPKQGFSVPWERWCRAGLGDELRARWAGLQHPYFNAKAADMLFPADGDGSPHLQWNAFATLTFLDGA